MKFTRARLAAALLFAACAGVVEMQAATRTWANIGTDWATDANWGGTAPTNDTTTDIASFGSGTAVNPNVGSALSINGLVFQTGGSAYSISGTSLTIGAGGITDSAGAKTQTINVPLVLGAAQTWLNNGTSANLAVAGTVDLGNFALTIQTGNTGTTSNTSVSGVISGSGTLTKSGGSTLTLSGANTYSGGTTISNGTTTAAGTLNINNGGSGGTSSAIGTGTLTIGGSSPAIDNTSGASVTLSTNNAQLWNSNFTFVGSNNLNLGTGTVTLGASRTVTTTANTLTVGGVIGGAFGLTKAGSGTLALSNSASTYTGATTINGGVLSVSTLANGGVNSSIGASANNATNLVIDGGGTLQYTGTTVSTDRKIKIGNTTAGGTAILDASGTGALTFSATGTSAFSYGTSNQTRSLVLTGNNTGNNTLSGILADNGTGQTTLTKNGTGTWLLSAANTYTGATTINGGTLALGASGALGVGGNVVFGGGTLQYSASNTTDHSSRIKNSTGAITVDTNNQTVTYAGVIDATNSGGLVKNGAGILILSGDNAYTGLTTIRNGTLKLGAAQRIADTVNVVLDAIVDNATATFDLNGNNETIGSLTFGGTGGTSVTNTVSTGAGTLTLGGDVTYLAAGNSNATLEGKVDLGGASRNFVIGDSSATNDLTVSAVISGSGFGLTKTDTGTLNLTGTSTYTGATTINAGTVIAGGTNSLGSGSAVTVNNGGRLLVNGSTGGSSFTIASGGTLGGSGTVGGATTIQSGGFLAPGNSPGVQTFNSGLTLDAGSTTTFEINGTGRGSTYDGIDVTGGTLTYGGALSFVFGSLISDSTTLDLFNLTNAASGTPSSIVATGSYTGSFTNNSGSWTFSDGSQQITFLQSTGDLSFAASAVPEPSTYVAIFGGVALVGVALRRRQQKKAAAAEALKAALQSANVVQL